MIPKSALKEFLSRELDDVREMKEWSLSRLDKEVAKLPVEPPIWSTLRKHQKVCFLLGVWYGRFAFWLDTGTGKTLLCIALALYYERLRKTEGKPLPKFLVLVPNRTNRREWVREINKHSKDATYEMLVGSTAEKWQLVEESDALLFVGTYGGTVRMICDLEATKRDKDKRKLVFKQKYLRKLVPHFAGLFADESTEMGNRSSLAFRFARQLVKEQGKTYYPLSGTPFGRDPTPLWSQMYLVDGGHSLGHNLGIFRAAFFRAVANYWTGFDDYKFDKKEKGALLTQRLAHRSIRYELDASDLPQVVRIRKEARLMGDMGTYFQAAKDQLRAAKGNYKLMQHAFMRARQISSGFLGYADDETGAKAKFEFGHNPKLELLLDLVDELAQGHKTLIYHEFIFSGAIISRELRRMKIKHARVYGGSKDPEGELMRFIQDPECRAFVFNSAGAFGLNLQIAKYLIVYESPIRPIMRKQVEGRIERPFSDHGKVVMYDLVTKGTYDEDILKSLQEGRDLFEAIVRGDAKA